MKKTIYFCFGDFRSGVKQYRIFKVRTVGDAYKVAGELGYEINLDSTIKDANIANHEERIIVSILETIHSKLKGIENVVSCHREERKEAERMKRHFLNSDMGLYFPKILPAPVRADFVINGIRIKVVRRDYPWVEEYWTRKYQKSLPHVISVRMHEPDDDVMQNAAIREKRQ